MEMTREGEWRALGDLERAEVRFCFTLGECLH